MIFKVNRVDIWAAGSDGEPGGLATKLAALADAGANFDFIVSRRMAEQPGNCVVFVTPIEGDRQLEAAAKAGFKKSASLQSIRIEGVDRPGVSAQIAGALAAANIAVRGVSSAVIGKRFVMYLAVNSDGDAEKAVKLLQEMS